VVVPFLDKAILTSKQPASTLQPRSAGSWARSYTPACA